LELVQRARKGDKNAFKELVRKYENQVAGTVIGMLGYCTEADDIGQETFFRFYRSLHKFRGKSSVGTYLTRIAINLSLNEIKRRKRRRELHVSDEEEKIGNVPDDDNRDSQKELREIVRTGIQKLNPKHRAVIVLRLMQGYTTEETAQILGLPVGTVLSRLARAQKQLKKILIPLYRENEGTTRG
jgi:RNA polymerase sigma-70 factor (ECF subfamily)